MKELDMCKAFAVLEGMEFLEHDNSIFTHDDNGWIGFYSEIKNKSVMWSEFNPITDQCLTFQAAIDYGVNLSHETCDVWIPDENAGEYDSGFLALVKFEEGGIPKAIIECILKSRGLYE